MRCGKLIVVELEEIRLDVVYTQVGVLSPDEQVDVLGPGVVPPHAPARKQVLIEGPHGLDTYPHSVKGHPDGGMVTVFEHTGTVKVGMVPPQNGSKKHPP